MLSSHCLNLSTPQTFTTCFFKLFCNLPKLGTLELTKASPDSPPTPHTKFSLLGAILHLLRQKKPIPHLDYFPILHPKLV